MGKRRASAEPSSAPVRKKPGCEGCPALCCRDLAIQIPRPRTRRDAESLKWQLHFDTVSVFIVNHRWHLMIVGKCIYLSDDNLCTIYDMRPQRCRRHNPPNCERYGEFYDVMIRTPEELDAYLDKEKARRARKRRAKRRHSSPAR